jgi:hypothetical protein
VYLLIHIGMGLVYPSLFTWSGSGILTALLLAAVVQVIDLLGIRVLARLVNRELRDAEEVQRLELREPGIFKRWTQFLLIKLLWYPAVTLVAAQVARSMAA